MNAKYFLFKVFITLWLVIKTMLLITPIVMILVLAKEGAWKYGFDYIEPSFNVAIFVGFSLSFMLVAYHALSFEVIGNSSLLSFLKTSQTGYAKSTHSLEAIAEKLGADRNFDQISLENDIITLQRKVRFMPKDKISITPTENGLHKIHSLPFHKWWYIDFGRNLKNVNDIKVLLES
jgi:hypothetical protein